MLLKNGVAMESKPFSIGARIEHPQTMIDKSLYGDAAGHEKLGSAPYKFVRHQNKKTPEAVILFACVREDLLLQPLQNLVTQSPMV